MALTSADILQLIKRETVRYEGTTKDSKDAYYDLVDLEEDNMSLMEKRLLRTRMVCTAEEINAISDSWANIKFQELNLALQSPNANKYYHAASCLLQSLFYFPIDTAYPNYRIREHLQGLQRVGAESVEGIALLGNLTATHTVIDDLYVIKTSKDPAGSRVTRHELVVGLYGLNNVKTIVPNFVYTYGGFSCGVPYISQERVQTWCDLGNPTSYLLIEYIPQARTLNDIMRTINYQNFLAVTQQIFYALEVAFQQCNFVHYDLHGGNILIRDLGRVYAFQYPKGYVHSRYLAVIIDYGFSHIVYEDTHYGRPGFDRYAIFSDDAWSIADYYKYIMSTAHTLLSRARDAENVKMFQLLSRLYSYFNNNEGLYNILTQHLEHLHSLFTFPYAEETRGYTVDGLLRVLEGLKPLETMPRAAIWNPPVPVEDVYASLAIHSQVAVPNNLIDLYTIAQNRIVQSVDLHTIAHRIPQSQHIDWQVYDSFPWEAAIDEHFQIFNTTLQDLTQRVGNLPDFSSYLGGVNYHNENEFLGKYIQLILTIDSYHKTQFYIEIFRFFVTVEELPENIQNLLHQKFRTIDMQYINNLGNDIFRVAGEVHTITISSKYAQEILLDYPTLSI